MTKEKKTTLYILTIIALLIVAVLLYLKDEKSTLDPALSDFALDEKDAPDSVVLRQDTIETVLSLKKGRWFLNGNFSAREQAVERFFNVLQNLKVESPASESAKETVIELLKENPVHVKIFEEGKKIKDYLVEDSKYKNGITYMMITGRDEPFLMNLPGHDGDIALLYRVDPNYWRNKVLFNYSGVDISRVKIYYPEKPEKSFILDYNKKDKFVLKSYKNKKEREGVDVSQSARYLSYFSNIRFESVIKDARLYDSLRNSTPYCEIEVKDIHGRQKKLVTYRKLADGQKDAFGQESYYDLNYLYGIYDNFGEILLIKYTEIDPLFKEIDYFRVE